MLIMTVDPGFGGQVAIESCLDKVRQVKEMADKLGQTVLIEVDGGIKLDNLERYKTRISLLWVRLSLTNREPALICRRFRRSWRAWPYESAGDHRRPGACNAAA